jgi:hypothetical protein
LFAAIAATVVGVTLAEVHAHRTDARTIASGRQPLAAARQDREIPLATVRAR